jgi:hypothetical protein
MTACQLYSLALFRVVAVVAGVVALACSSFAQQTEDAAATTAPVLAPAASVEHPPDNAPAPVDHRILGVLPNYRTANPLDVYEPLTAKQKFTIASKDAFDWPNFVLALGFAGIYQAQNANPSFGQGLKGYAHRYGTSLIDQSMGNMMTEGVMPALLHEDPRYFRKVIGSKKSRLGYALTRVLVTRTDSGGTRFNFSEVIGNGVMAGLGNLYYPTSRGVPDTMERLGLQVGTDALSNVLKEFWPDVKRHFHHQTSVE